MREGYLLRRPVPNDRRKTELLCTEKAQPVIRRGQQLQNDFFRCLFDGADEETRRAFSSALGTLEKNLDLFLAERSHLCTSR